MDFHEKLVVSAQEIGNIACMGLDSVVLALPEGPRQLGIAGFVPFLDEVLDEMLQQDVVPEAFKPNRGFYSRYDQLFAGDFTGSSALAKS